MCGGINSGGYSYYRCIGTDAYRFGGKRICQNKQIRTDLVDDLVWKKVTELLYSIFSDQPAPPPTQTVTQAGQHVSHVEEIALPSSRPEWCRTEFAVPDFAKRVSLSVRW